MTDYATQDRKKFLRQLRYTAALRALYAVIIVVSIGSTLVAVAGIFTKG